MLLPAFISCSLLSLRLQINHVAADRDAHINSAQRALNSVVDSARVRRADLKGTEERTQELWETINEVRQVNEKSESMFSVSIDSPWAYATNHSLRWSWCECSRPITSVVTNYIIE